MSNPRSLAVAVWTNWRRLAILLLLVIAVASSFLVPFFLDLDYLNRSVWADPTRYDSYGHSVLLSRLIGGHLFDGFNRVPMLGILAAVGFAVCLLRWRDARYLVPIAIFLLWMMLYFGRPTWGSLVDLLPMSRDIHMNRFIGGVHPGGHLSDCRRFGCPFALGHFKNKYLERLVRHCGSDVDHVGIAAGV